MAGSHLLFYPGGLVSESLFYSIKLNIFVGFEGQEYEIRVARPNFNQNETVKTDFHHFFVKQIENRDFQ